MYQEVYEDELDKELRRNRVRACEPEALLKDVKVRQLKDDVKHVLIMVWEERKSLLGKDK